jgi:hypothetical protein
MVGQPYLATLTANNALDRVEGGYAEPNTKLAISVVAVWHIPDHYGRLVEYLRLNGIVPPFTQKYGVKVTRGSVLRHAGLDPLCPAAVVCRLHAP